jgi:hypothetical protein
VPSTVVEYVGAAPSIGLRIRGTWLRNFGCRRLFEDVPHERRTRWEFEPPVDVVQVGGNGAAANEKSLGNLGVGQSLRHEPGDLRLTVAEPMLITIAGAGSRAVAQLAQHGSGTVSHRLRLQTIEHLEGCVNILGDGVSRVPGGMLHQSPVYPGDRLFIWHAQLGETIDCLVKVVQCRDSAGRITSGSGRQSGYPR